MHLHNTEIPDVVIIEPRLFSDERGFFAETWRRERYEEAGITGTFVQDNVSRSSRGVVRGLHFQNPTPQGKLVMALTGSIFDVAVDLRRGSPTFGRWVGAELSSETLRQLWIPRGFAHGFQALSDGVVVAYKCTGSYSPPDERAIRWDDPDIGIQWPIADARLSPRDLEAPRLRDLPEEWLFER